MPTVRDLTAVRARPDASAEQVTQVLPGEPLELDERRGGWVHVVTAYGYPGWIDRSAVGGRPDERWLTPRAASPLDYAHSLVGARYEWGGMTSDGIDCSGLVHMSFRAAGRLVPRDADQQEVAGEAQPEEQLQPGDLVSYGDAAADHVAFWLGEGRILHATQRDGVDGVVGEAEPEELRLRRRLTFRL